MRIPLSEKLKAFFGSIICKFTGHEYGCCNKVFVNCKKCIK